MIELPKEKEVVRLSFIDEEKQLSSKAGKA